MQHFLSFGFCYAPISSPASYIIEPHGRISFFYLLTSCFCHILVYIISFVGVVKISSLPRPTFLFSKGGKQRLFSSTPIQLWKVQFFSHNRMQQDNFSPYAQHDSLTGCRNGSIKAERLQRFTQYRSGIWNTTAFSGKKNSIVGTSQLCCSFLHFSCHSVYCCICNGYFLPSMRIAKSSIAFAASS